MNLDDMGIFSCVKTFDLNTNTPEKPRALHRKIRQIIKQKIAERERGLCVETKKTTMNYKTFWEKKKIHKELISCATLHRFEAKFYTQMSFDAEQKITFDPDTETLDKLIQNIRVKQGNIMDNSAGEIIGSGVCEKDEDTSRNDSTIDSTRQETTFMAAAADVAELHNIGEDAYCKKILSTIRQQLQFGYIRRGVHYESYRLSVLECDCGKFNSLPWHDLRKKTVKRVVHELVNGCRLVTATQRQDSKIYAQTAFTELARHSLLTLDDDDDDDYDDNFAWFGSMRQKIYDPVRVEKEQRYQSYINEGVSMHYVLSFNAPMSQCYISERLCPSMRILDTLIFQAPKLSANTDFMLMLLYHDVTDGQNNLLNVGSVRTEIKIICNNPDISEDIFVSIVESWLRKFRHFAHKPVTISQLIIHEVATNSDVEFTIKQFQLSDAYNENVGKYLKSFVHPSDRDYVKSLIYDNECNFNFMSNFTQLNTLRILLS